MEAKDADLVGATRAGNPEAYETLVSRYQGHVYGLAYSLVGNWADAQDIAQEAFIRAYVNLDQLKQPDRFAPWLRRVTFSVAMNWLKAFRPGIFRQLDGQIDVETLEIPDFEPGPAEELERRELAQAVHRAIASLPPRYRVPLTMFHLDGLSYQKVAEFLDIPLGNVKVLIHRARAKLKALLSDYVTGEVGAVMQEVFNEHKLKPEFAEKVMASIQGVPRLKWGEWRDCTYGGAVTVLLNTIGVPVTYEQVMGLSGACYRICMKDGTKDDTPDTDWDPSAAMPQCGYDVETPLYRALGFDVYRIADEGGKRQKAIECIDKGIPVLCGDQRGFPEWGLLTGYADNGRVFFGRTYADYRGAKADEVFTESGYFLADKYPGFDVQFFDRRGEPLSPKDALKQSLETCIGTLNQGPGDWGYIRGYQAYDFWIQGLEDPHRFKVFPDELNGGHMDQLKDARRCAHVYLKQSLDLLEHGSRRRLERAVGLFRAMLDKLAAVAPYGGSFDFTGTTCRMVTASRGKPEPWDMGKRRGFADVLRELCAMERQVEAEFRAILDDWK